MYMAHFSKTERLELSILLKKGYSQRGIAHALSRDPSSVSRELKRGQVNGRYNPLKAHHKAYVRRKYSKYQGMKIREHPELEAYVRERIVLSWSPERIAGRWSREHTHGIHISAKGVYKYLYGNHGQYFCRYLKYKRYRRKKRKQTQSVREVIKNRIFIDVRPKIISERKRFGDFEADTLGKPMGTKETLVGVIERKSRFVFAKRIIRLRYTIATIKELTRGIPARSFTFDNGRENARHQELGVPTYFCHPYSSWEKGQVEHVFGRIREYIPKRSKVSDYTDDDIAAIINRINDTPMKCLKYQTPREVFEGRFLKNHNRGVAFQG
mgnify:FL=1